MKATHLCLVIITFSFIQMANRFIFHSMKEQVFIYFFPSIYLWFLKFILGYLIFFIVMVILWLKYQSFLFFYFWVVFFFAGSGFVSHDLYLHGYFSASIKLPADYTAGVVVAFYVSGCLKLFLKIKLYFCFPFFFL